MWRDTLKKYNYEFKLLTKDNWNDLSKIDVLIGIRDFNKRTYDHKPPSKLINAWQANIPFIGGYDSAYEQVGNNGINYFKVNSFKEVVEILILLKNNRGIYKSIVDEGKKKAIIYSRDKIIERWCYILLHEVVPIYESWKTKQNTISNMITFYLRYMLDQLYNLPYNIYKIIYKIIK